MMKVGFNGWFLARPQTGIGQYTLHLLNALASTESSFEGVVIVPTPLEVELPSNLRVIVVPEYALPTASLRKWAWEQFQVPRRLKKEQVDIAHYPYPANPRFPRGPHPKVLVTVHDVIPWTDPQYRRRLRTRLYQRWVKKALQKATHILCVSQATADALTDQIKFPLQKVTVVHEAAGPAFSTDPIRLPKKKKPTRPYLVYVGGYDARKNVSRLVEAFEEYIVPHYDIDLVLVGAENRSNPHYTEANALQAHGNVRTTDSLTQPELIHTYQNALALINVSLAEGFNLPLLEAAACGTPIITSDLPVHREILENHALFCDPRSTKSIGETLLDFLHDPSLQEQLKNATQALREHYSWEKAARETRQLYSTL